MSFVILSNNKVEDGIVANEGTMDKPFAFKNNLSSTYEIPANSEVALQSAKVNLDGSIIVGKDNRVFYAWFGRLLSRNASLSTLFNIDQTINTPIKITLAEDQVGFLKISPPDLAPYLQEELSTKLYHPQLVNKVSVNSKYVSGKWSGYDIDISQSRADPLVNYIPATNTAVDAYDERVRDGTFAAEWTYDGGTGVFNVANQNTEDEIAAASFDVPPLTNKQAVFQVDITGVVGANATESVIGLSRDATVLTGATGNYVYPGHIEMESSVGAFVEERLPRFLLDGTAIDGTPDWCSCYFDYGAVFQRNGAALNLRLYHCVGNEDNNLLDFQAGSWEMQEMDYTVVGGAALYNYDWAVNADNYEKIKWTVSGDEVILSIIDRAAAETVLMNYDNTRNLDQNLCPVEQGRWSMFPVLGIYNYENAAGQYDRSLTMETWNGSNATMADWATNPDVFGWVENPDATWNRRIDEDNFSPFISAALSTRIPLDYSAGVGVSPYKYETVDATTPFNYQLFQPNLIVMPSDLYEPSNQASMANILGFPQTPIAFGTTPDVATGNYVITSASVPNMVSIKSIFVRLDNLTTQSVNAKVGSLSRIIGHLPRHVESDVSNYGPMYLEASNLIYVKLNNPSPIKLQSFDVSLVFLDETYATNLVGSTVICLHIRKSTD